ncbi:MAG: tyrosine-protein phosphatase [Actinomycetota bacterium]|nr:tyrosine-protein phosphatase [Actinomycetota bacterium]
MKWLGERGRDGGIDTVPLPGVAGGLSLCGKHAIGPDHAAAMARCGATTVVCLVEERELADRYPQYVQWLHANSGGAAIWYPIHDLHAPPMTTADHLLHDVLARLHRGEHLLMHCAAGIGRTGTIAACLLIELGMGRDDALALVSASRPMAGPEVGAQIDLVNAIAVRRGQRGSSGTPRPAK